MALNSPIFINSGPNFGVYNTIWFTTGINLQTKFSSPLLKLFMMSYITSQRTWLSYTSIPFVLCCYTTTHVHCNHLNLGMKQIHETKSFWWSSFLLVIEASLAEVQVASGCGKGDNDIICSFTSFFSHIILTLQLCGAFCSIWSAMPFCRVWFHWIYRINYYLGSRAWL